VVAAAAEQEESVKVTLWKRPKPNFYQSSSSARRTALANTPLSCSAALSCRLILQRLYKFLIVSCKIDWKATSWSSAGIGNSIAIEASISAWWGDSVSESKSSLSISGDEVEPGSGKSAWRRHEILLGEGGPSELYGSTWSWSSVGGTMVLSKVSPNSELMFFAGGSGDGMVESADPIRPISKKVVAKVQLFTLNDRISRPICVFWVDVFRRFGRRKMGRGVVLLTIGIPIGFVVIATRRPYFVLWFREEIGLRVTGIGAVEVLNWIRWEWHRRQIVVLPPVFCLPKKDETKIRRDTNVSKEFITVSCVLDV